MIEEEEDGPVMQAVTGPLGPKMADQGMAEESQVADKIKGFMADKFVPEAQGSADDFLFVEDHSIVQRSPESQVALAELGNVLQEAERPGRSDLLEEELSGQRNGDLLPADDRMGKINGVGHSEIRVGGEGYAGPFVLDCVRLDDTNRPNRLGDRPEPGLQDGLSQGSRASVQSGDFCTMEFKFNAIDAQNIEDCQEVLQGQDAARSKDEDGAIEGVDSSGIDFNFEAAQVHPPEKNGSL